MLCATGLIGFMTVCVWVMLCRKRGRGGRHREREGEVIQLAESSCN